MLGVSDLLTATRPTPTADSGVFTLEVLPGWNQGRGAFGGLVLGALTRAIEACEPEKERVLRSLTGELAGPVVTGAAKIAIETVRRGSGVSTFRASLAQNGELLAVATAVLGKTRISDRRWSPAPPVMRPWRDVEPAPLGPPFTPDFSQFMEYRPTGPLPFTGDTEPIAEGWIRTRAPLPRIGAPEIVALADAYWPAGFAIETGPRPVGTVAFTLQYFPPQSPLDPNEPLFYRARAIAAADGYIVEHRELWTGNGDLVALNPQTFVWIR